MDFILIVILTIALLTIVANMSDKKENVSDKLIIEKKQCPPHQWFWQDIVDQNGVKHGERIVCKVCGPMKNRDDV